MSVNLQIIVGNVGEAPEKRFFPNGDAYATFSIATNREYIDKNNNQKKQVTTWHNVVAHRKLADVVSKYVQSGDKIYVQGETRKRQYEHRDHADVKMGVTEVHLTRLELLPNARNQEGIAADMEDDLPSDEPQGMHPSQL